MGRNSTCGVLVAALVVLVFPKNRLARTVPQCEQQCAVQGGRSVCDADGNFVAANACVAIRCNSTSATDLKPCPEDYTPKLANREASEDSATDNQRSEQTNSAANQTACAACTESGPNRPLCDRDGYFVAQSLCAVRFCAGITSIADLVICPDGGKMREHESEESDEPAEEVSETVEAMEEAYEVMREAAGGDPMRGQLMAVEGAIEEQAAAIKPVGSQRQEVMSMLQSSIATFMALQADSPGPGPTMQQRSGKAGVRAISNSDCSELCDGEFHFEIAAPVCDQDGVVVAESMCKARFCMGLVDTDGLDYCSGGKAEPLSR
mmetsp:Transcript_14136/g.36281  ORF Transcript_14136/g.36281 Transcript_14136/m.36281 type:complete len:321 (+) Transcript_14136:147-1109(+)